MEIKVKSLYLKSSPQKVRECLHGLRGQNPEKAITKLIFTNRKGADYTREVIKSAIAIAKENDLDLNTLFIKSISCNEGPRLKRRQIGSRGRSDAIKKRMCHINLVLSNEPEVVKIEETKETKEEKEVKEVNNK